MGIFLRSLPELSFGHALGKCYNNWIGRCLRYRLSLGRTPVHSLSAKLQPFYGHPPFATSFKLTGNKGFVDIFICICEISLFCICEYHRFDTLMLVTRRSNGFIEFFNCICQISMFCIFKLFNSAVFLIDPNWHFCSFTTLFEVEVLNVTF